MVPCDCAGHALAKLALDTLCFRLVLEAGGASSSVFSLCKVSLAGGGGES